MDLFAFYAGEAAEYAVRLRRVRRRRNRITFAKIASFALIVWGIVILVSDGVAPQVWIGAAGVVAFIFFSWRDGKVVTAIGLLEEQIRCIRTEEAYLKGDLSGLPDGEEFRKPGHPYALDLDLLGRDSLYRAVNRTVTRNGSKLLADWLLRPCLEEREIRQRQEAAGELAGRIGWTHLFRATGALYRTEGTEEQAIEAWLQEASFFRFGWLRGVLYGVNGAALLCWAAAFAGLVSFHIPLILFSAQLLAVLFFLKRINGLHRRLDRFVRAVGNYFYLVRLIDGEPFASARMAELKKRLSGREGALAAFAGLNRILGGFDQRNNVLAALVVNGIYMRDFHQVIRLERWRARYGGDIVSWIAAVSATDALVSMANYRFSHPGFCVPEIGGEGIFGATNLAHPLLRGENVVANDFEVEKLHRLFIITGANMAGKSTFLRAVGVNLVLALSGNVVCAGTFVFRPVRLFTSMRTTDNLAEGTSYFHAELLRLKELIGYASEGGPLFIILDEMLKGTNSKDKLNGSLRFLERLIGYPVSGLVATHDLALGELAEEDPEHFRNVCFEIEHEGDEITYDYKLREGVSRNMNASLLLEQMGLI